jgi:hypothetical protein
MPDIITFPFFYWDTEDEEHAEAFCRICPECGEHVMATDEDIATARRGERETGDFLEHLQHDWRHWETNHG